jgi:hypothetical protein
MYAFHQVALILALLFSTCLQAQNYNVPYRKGNLWGYSDKTGKIVITPKYDSVSPENENMRWFVFKNNKMGVINQLGQEIIPAEYDLIERNPVHSEYNEFYVARNGKMGYTDMDGRFILPLAYKTIDKYEGFREYNLLCFLVKKENENTWTLIDKDQKAYLAGITAYDKIYGGHSILQISGKEGIYDMGKKQWVLKPVYDSIRYLQYKDAYRLKSGFESYEYYGKKGKQLDLISKTFQVKTFAGKKLDNFFELMPDERDVIYAPDMKMGTADARIVSVAGSKFIENKIFPTFSHDNSEVKSVVIIKNNNLYGLQIRVGYGKLTSPVEFDEIQLLVYENDACNKDVVLVSREGKLGIYSLPENKLVTPVIYSAILPDKKNDDILLLTLKNKTGLYKIEDGSRDKGKSAVIDAVYDSFLKRGFIKSNDFNYNMFNLYYFTLNSKICPVGVNGVKFYEE